MKLPAITSYDDLEYTENDKHLVLAEHTVILIVREGGGETAVSLDFSDDNHTLFWKEIQRWFNMGEQPSSAKRSRKTTHPDKAKRKSPNAAIFRNRRMRAFGDEHGYSYTKRDDGTYNHSPELVKAFAEWEKDNRE